MDGPHAARSGHQGTAMSLAPLAHVLFTRVMKYDASRPDWATVIERRQGIGDPDVMDEILTKHKPIASRIRHLIDAL